MSNLYVKASAVVDSVNSEKQFKVAEKYLLRALFNRNDKITFTLWHDLFRRLCKNAKGSDDQH